MDSSKDRQISYNNNFFFLVSEGEYEWADSNLPMIINLLQYDKETRDNALHICAKNDFLISFKKIFKSAHPALGLILLQKNKEGDTPLALLISRQHINAKELILNILNKIESTLTAQKINEILEPIVEKEGISENENFGAIIAAYDKNNKKLFLEKTLLSNVKPYHVLYSNREAAIAPVFNKPDQVQTIFTSGIKPLNM